MTIDRLGIPDLSPAYDARGFISSRNTSPNTERALHMQQRLERNLALCALQDQIAKAKLSIDQIHQLQETLSEMQQSTGEADG